MKRRVCRTVVCVLTLPLLASSIALGAESLSGISMTTLAGSGAAGIADGDGKDAQFIAPAAIAVDPQGTVYVADRASQRIKAIDKAGNVRTLAGSGQLLGAAIGVSGGYRDGNAAGAQFNTPLGLAAARDGSVYVADTKNHCIRLIRHGIVSTVAGSPSRSGGADGPGAAASFLEPRSLALGIDGSLYVADYPNGVRVITPDHFVRTFPAAQSDELSYVSSVSTYVSQGTEYLLAASVSAVSVYEIKSNHLEYTRRLRNIADIFDYGDRSDKVIGPPSAIAALGPLRFVYTDAYYSSIELCAWIECHFLTRAPDFEAPTHGGGFQNGLPSQALVDQPEGLAVAPDGSVVVADTGNKRIRRILGVGRVTDEPVAANPDLIGSLARARFPKEYRIAIVGNSYIDSGLPEEETIAARLQTSLGGVSAHERDIRTYSLARASLTRDTGVSLIDEELSTGLVDAIVFDLPLYFDRPFQSPQGGERFAQWDDRWVAATDASLRRLSRHLSASGIVLYVLAHPLAWDLPGEMVYRQFPKRPNTLDSIDFADELGIPDPAEVARSARAVSVLAGDPALRFIDLFPAFFEERASAKSHPLFMTWDHHFTPYATALIAKALARRLEHDAPWQAASPR